MTDTPDLRRQQRFIADDTYSSGGHWETVPPEPALPELLEKVRDHVMTDEEKEAQPKCRACYRTEPSAFCSAEANCMFRKKVEAGAQPEPDERAPEYDWWLIRFDDAEMLPEVVHGEKQAILLFAARLLNWNCQLFRMVDDGKRTRETADQARAGSSPAPSPAIQCESNSITYRPTVAGECMSCGSFINKCGHSKMRVYSRNCNDGSGMSETHCSLCKRAGVTGNEGKDEMESRGKDIAVDGGAPSGIRVGSDGASLPEPLASPAVVTPEQFLADWWTEHGGEIFDFMRAKVSELEAQLQQARSKLAILESFDETDEGWVY